MKSTRLFILTSLAMIAFASNSLLCRLALKQTTIDRSDVYLRSRSLSGAVALWLVLEIRTRLRTERTASRLFEDLLARYVSLALVIKTGNWPSALALFVYAAAFSFAYVGLPAGTGALLLFGCGAGYDDSLGISQGRALGPYSGFWTSLLHLPDSFCLSFPVFPRRR